MTDIMKKNTKQLDVSKMDEIKQGQYAQLAEKVVKASLAHKKVLAVYIGFDAKGDAEITYWGASPEIEKRAHFLATKLGDQIPLAMAKYDLPVEDVDNNEAQG